VANCGHVAPLVIRADGTTERLAVREAHGLGGRASPKPSERTERLSAGDRLILVSDGVIKGGAGKAGLGFDGLIAAACRSERASAADTVRKIHQAVLDASEGELEDDATAVCLSVG
jgi:serine phosphatase RsbU (regulator of sigma subunit)